MLPSQQTWDATAAASAASCCNANAKGLYSPAKAHVQAKERLSGPGNVRTITSEQWALVVRYVALGLSPQQISGWLKVEKQFSIRIEVDEAVYALNHRPRKCLDYRTPHEGFF